MSRSLWGSREGDEGRGGGGNGEDWGAESGDEGEDGAGVEVGKSRSEEDEGKVSCMNDEADGEDDGASELGGSEEDADWGFGVRAGGGCGGGREGSVLLGKSVVRRAKRKDGRSVLGLRKWVVRVWERNLDRRLC